MKRVLKLTESDVRTRWRIISEIERYYGQEKETF